MSKNPKFLNLFHILKLQDNPSPVPTLFKYSFFKNGNRNNGNRIALMQGWPIPVNNNNQLTGVAPLSRKLSTLVQNVESYKVIVMSSSGFGILTTALDPDHGTVSAAIVVDMWNRRRRVIDIVM